jgi:hypothetical protein
MKKIIIVLGSPNSAKGRLGKIAIARAKKCLEIFNPTEHKIICTGGIGQHFNTTEKPHAFYLKRYLQRKGIPSSSFLPFAESSNTVEDATKSKEVLKANLCSDVTIVTSFYHLQRVQIIFDEILHEFNRTYCGTENNCSLRRLKKFENHEQKAIEGILRNGLYY